MKKTIICLILLFTLVGVSATSIEFVTTDYSGASVQTADFNITVYIIPFPIVSVDDNTIPSFVGIWPQAFSITQEPVVRFWVEMEDDWDAKGAWYGFYLNGFLDFNGFADVNSDGFGTILTSDLVVTGDQGHVVIYAITDVADNNLNQVFVSDLYSFQLPPHVFDPEDVIDEDIEDAISYAAYTSAVAVGTYAAPLLVTIIGISILYITILFMVLKRG